jgi:hypothetical protein
MRHCTEGRALHAAVLLAAGVLMSFVRPASAQNFRVIDPAGGAGKAPHEWAPFSHWDLREMPGCAVPWTRGIAPTPDLDGNGVADEANDQNIAQATFAAAFDRWDAVTPNELDFNNIFIGIPAGGAVLDDWNTISFGVLPVATNGVTSSWIVPSSGVIVEADIELNSSPDSIPFDGRRKWVIRAHGSVLDNDTDSIPQGNWPNGVGDTDWNGNNRQEYEVDLGKTSTHEIGHFLGLDHIFPLGGASNNHLNALMEEFNWSGIGDHGGGWTNIVLKNPDTDGMNFLYCPDLGDAPDPWMGVFNQYPTLVHIPLMGRTLNGIVLDAIGEGAEHILGIKQRQPARNWTYEWLAHPINGDVDSECEANIVDIDPLDDGVKWYPNPPIWGRTMTVVEFIRYASDNVGNAHDYFASPMYANAWLDVNQNCIWEEHFLHVPVVVAPPIGINNVFLTAAAGAIALPHFVDQSKAVWLRCRLDWGEDVGSAANIDGTLAGPAGAAQFGEVEDYPFYCRNRYHQIWFCNPFPFPIPGFAMVVVGAPDPSDQTFSAVVDGNDCPTGINPAPNIAYAVTQDETVIDFPVPTSIPPFTYAHFGRCRPPVPPPVPQTTARCHVVTEETPAGTPANLVPDQYKVPTVNCAYRGYSPGDPEYGKVLFTVGAVDAGSGGWIGGPDPVTREWEDTLRVTVGYRVSPSLVPLSGLSPCDPYYSTLTLTSVGTGMVTPQDAFEFTLDVPDDVPHGHHVILEVQTSWSTSPIVSNEIIEFPDPMGEPTDVDATPRPRQLALENYPNPFNPSTTIRYALPAPAKVTLAVYDVSGRLVRTIVRDVARPAGVFEAMWDGTDSSGQPVASGVYFYRLQAGPESLTRKAVLLK